MALRRPLVAPLVLFLVFRDRYGIDAGQPAVQIHVGTAARAERPRRLRGGLTANRTKMARRFGPGRVYGRDAAPRQDVFLGTSGGNLNRAPYTAFSQPKWIG